MQFFPALHGLRGLAALMVLFYHWRTNFPAFGNTYSRVDFLGEKWNFVFLIDQGWVGVQWFFVLSGYLLAGVLWNKPLTTRHVVHFWQRRFTRIYPGLWFQIGVLALLTSYTLLLKDLDPERMRNNILLWLDPLPGGSVPYNGVWWTLPVELGFYLVLPLCLFLYRRSGVWTLLLSGFALSVAWRYGVVQWCEATGRPIDLGLAKQLPGSLCLFLTGMALNHWKERAAWLQGGKVLLGMLGLYLLWLFVLGRVPRSLSEAHWVVYFWEPVVGLFIAGILYLAVRPTPALRWLESKPLQWLGAWSYGIYLWHFPVLRLLPRTVPGPWKTYQGSLLALLICLVLTLLLAMLSYYLVERPALNVVARWQKRAT